MLISIKRLFATFIDAIIILFIVLYPFNIIISLFNENILLKNIMSSICVFTIIISFLSKDLVFTNASIGKKILHIGIYKENGQLPSKRTLFNRNITSLTLFPIYWIQVLDKNKTTSDIKYNTKVSTIERK